MSSESIKSVSQYVEEVCNATKKCKNFYPIVNEAPLFRGQPDTAFELLPSIGRGRKSEIDVTILNEERNLIDMAKFRMPSIFTNDLKPVELLAMLQHHGIPTRLLDVTENALVALYFACCDEKCMNKNGEVIVFKDTQRTVGNYPIIEAIADTYRLCRGTWIRPKEFFQNAQNMDYFAEQKYLLQLMNNNKRDNKDASFISDYDSWLLGIANNPLFIYAPFTNLRQRMQQGRYILFPNAIDKENDTVIIKDLIRPISKDSECVVARIQIAAEDKENILRELKFFGISRQTLFPDNVDIVCDEIKKAAYNKIQDKN